MLVLQICFFVVFSLFHTSAFQIEKKMFDQIKKVGFTDFFFITEFRCKVFVKYYKPNNSQHPFTWYYLPKTYFSSFIGIKQIYICIGFINNCDVIICTPNADTFFISPWEESLFCCFFSIPHNSQGLFLTIFEIYLIPMLRLVSS